VISEAEKRFPRDKHDGRDEGDAANDLARRTAMAEAQGELSSSNFYRDEPNPEYEP
jgi:hypothetical protein